MADEVVRRFSKRNDDIRDALTKPGYDPGAASPVTFLVLSAHW
jgi:hypothetical protein